MEKSLKRLSMCCHKTLRLAKSWSSRRPMKEFTQK